MSIEGFKINNQVVKYDYDSLDNLPSGGGSGLTDEIKEALLQLASKVAYIDANGQDYYDDLHNALYTETPATLVSISAVYTQSGTVYDTDSLDSLKSDLVVTAYYDDSSSHAVSGYTLSGILTVGISTITVSYSGKTTSFTVTVSQPSQGDVFGIFTNGYAIGKKMNSSQGASSMAMYSVWNNSASARAAMTEPVANNNYTLTVTDSTKYNLAVYGITDSTAQSTTYQYAITGEYFQGDSVAPSFAASGNTTANYLMVSLKKMDNTAFTTEELANGAEAVFTYTTT